MLRFYYRPTQININEGENPNVLIALAFNSKRSHKTG